MSDASLERIMYKGQYIDQMTVKTLKDHLRKLGEHVSGKKSELIERLQKKIQELHDELHSNNPSQNSTGEADSTTGGSTSTASPHPDHSENRRSKKQRHGIERTNDKHDDVKTNDDAVEMTDTLSQYANAHFEVDVVAQASDIRIHTHGKSSSSQTTPVFTSDDSTQVVLIHPKPDTCDADTQTGHTARVAIGVQAVVLSTTQGTQTSPMKEIASFSLDDSELATGRKRTSLAPYSHKYGENSLAPTNNDVPDSTPHSMNSAQKPQHFASSPARESPPHKRRSIAQIDSFVPEPYPQSTNSSHGWPTSRWSESRPDQRQNAHTNLRTPTHNQPATRNSMFAYQQDKSSYHSRNSLGASSFHSQIRTRIRPAPPLRPARRRVIANPSQEAIARRILRTLRDMEAPEMTQHSRTSLSFNHLKQHSQDGRTNDESEPPLTSQTDKRTKSHVLREQPHTPRVRFSDQSNEGQQFEDAEDDDDEFKFADPSEGDNVAVASELAAPLAKIQYAFTPPSRKRPKKKSENLEPVPFADSHKFQDAEEIPIPSSTTSQTSIVKEKTKPDNQLSSATPTTSQGFPEAIWKKKDDIKCPNCWVFQPKTNTKCMACDAELLGGQAGTDNNGFPEAIWKKKGDIKCPNCWVFQPKTNTKCMACDAELLGGTDNNGTPATPKPIQQVSQDNTTTPSQKGQTKLALKPTGGSITAKGFSFSKPSTSTSNGINMTTSVANSETAGGNVASKGFLFPKSSAFASNGSTAAAADLEAKSSAKSFFRTESTNAEASPIQDPKSSIAVEPLKTTGFFPHSSQGSGNATSGFKESASETSSKTPFSVDDSSEPGGKRINTPNPFATLNSKTTHEGASALTTSNPWTGTSDSLKVVSQTGGTPAAFGTAVVAQPTQPQVVEEATQKLSDASTTTQNFEPAQKVDLDRSPLPTHLNSGGAASQPSSVPPSFTSPKFTVQPSKSTNSQTSPNPSNSSGAVAESPTSAEARRPPLWAPPSARVNPSSQTTDPQDLPQKKSAPVFGSSRLPGPDSNGTSVTATGLGLLSDASSQISPFSSSNSNSSKPAFVFGKITSTATTDSNVSTTKTGVVGIGENPTRSQPGIFSGPKPANTLSSFNELSKSSNFGQTSIPKTTQSLTPTSQSPFGPQGQSSFGTQAQGPTTFTSSIGKSMQPSNVVKPVFGAPNSGSNTSSAPNSQPGISSFPFGQAQTPSKLAFTDPSPTPGQSPFGQAAHGPNVTSSPFTFGKSQPSSSLTGHSPFSNTFQGPPSNQSTFGQPQSSKIAQSPFSTNSNSNPSSGFMFGRPNVSSNPNPTSNPFTRQSSVTGGQTPGLSGQGSPFATSNQNPNPTSGVFNFGQSQTQASQLAPTTPVALGPQVGFNLGSEQKQQQQRRILKAKRPVKQNK